MECNHCKQNINDTVYDITTPSTNVVRFFCSKNCLDSYKRKYHIGTKKSLETRTKIAKSNSKPLTEVRKRNISLARRKPYDLNPDDMIRLDMLLEKPYYSYRLISESLNLKYNRVIQYSKSHTDSDIIKANTIRIVNKHRKARTIWNDIDALTWLAENVQKYTRDEISKKYNIHLRGMTTDSDMLKYFGKTYKRASYSFHGGITSPEFEFKTFLDLNGINYEYNKMISVTDTVGKIIYYSVDFVINDNIYVEIQGDYWHGNPKIYERSSLNGVQRSNINRDSRKKAQLITLKSPIKYYQIWEHDINNDSDIYKNYKNEILCIVQKLKV